MGAKRRREQQRETATGRVAVAGAKKRRRARGRGGFGQADDDDEYDTRYIDSSRVPGLIGGGDFDAMSPAQASAAIREIWGSPFAAYILTRGAPS